MIAGKVNGAIARYGRREIYTVYSKEILKLTNIFLKTGLLRKEFRLCGMVSSGSG